MKLHFLVLILALVSSANAQRIVSDSIGQPVNRTTNSLPESRLTNAGLRQSVVKINPLSLLVGHLSASYERVLTDSLSIVIGYGMGSNRWNFGTQLYEGGCTYQRITLEARYYWKGNVLNRFYVGPYLRFSRLTESYFVLDSQGKSIQNSDGNRQTATHLAGIWIPGVQVGRQVQKKRFCLDGFVGLQLQLVSGTLNRSNQLVEAMTGLFMVRTGLNLGLAF